LKKSSTNFLSKKTTTTTTKFCQRKNAGHPQERTFHEELPRYEEAAMLRQWKALGTAALIAIACPPRFTCNGHKRKFK
jgi:hypothetical protein